MNIKATPKNLTVGIVTLLGGFRLAGGLTQKGQQL